jgi:hypothetical protein
MLTPEWPRTIGGPKWAGVWANLVPEVNPYCGGLISDAETPNPAGHPAGFGES